MTSGRKGWLAALLLSGVFVSGAVTALGALWAFAHHRLRALHDEGPHQIHRMGVELLDWELDLTDEQREQIDALLLEVHLEFFRFKSEHNEELKAIVDDALARLDATLTSEQRERWRPMRDRIAAHAATTWEDRFGPAAGHDAQVEHAHPSAAEHGAGATDDP